MNASNASIAEYGLQLIEQVKQLERKNANLTQTIQSLTASQSPNLCEESLHTYTHKIQAQNITAQRTIRDLELQLESATAQLSQREFDVKSHVKVRDGGQVLEFTKQIDVLQVALQTSLLAQQKLTKKNKELVLRIKQLEGLAKETQGALESGAKHERYIEIEKIREMRSCTETENDYSGALNNLQTPTKRLSPSSKQTPLTVDINRTLTSTPTQVSPVQLPKDHTTLLQLVSEFLQRIKETDILFLNRSLSAQLHVPIITQLSTQLLEDLRSEVYAVESYGDVGMVFCGVLVEVIGMRIDMNGFYGMYYEKIEEKRGEALEKEGGEVRVSEDAWLVEKAIDRFWGIFGRSVEEK